MSELVIFIAKGLAITSFTAAAFFVIWYLTHKAEQKRWNMQIKLEQAKYLSDQEARERKEAAERKERDAISQDFRQRHLDIMQMHKEDMERAYKLLEREVQVGELHASLLQTMAGKFESHKICPHPYNPKQEG